MLMLKTVTVLEAISKRRRTARPAAHTGLSKNTIFAATHSAEDALVLLDATANGLTVEQATERLNAVGPNTIEATTKTLARRIADAFIDPFAGILAALALVSLYIDVLAVPEPQRDPSTVIVIGIMLLVSGGMKFIQEARSGNAAEALKDLVSNTCTALRDGERIEIPFDELVPGDVIRLSAGDMVPADARIITARDLFVIESALTGESEAVEKTTAVTVVEGADGSALPLSACKNIVFTGTSVQNGAAMALVVATGSDTYLGGIAKMLNGRGEKSAFDRGVSSVSMLLVRLMLVMAPAVFAINAATKGNVIDALLFATSVAVGITPQMLPVIVTTSLSQGAKDLARRQVIVKELPAIQNLGAMDVLCCDKTGTLTEDRIVLERGIIEGRRTYGNLLKYLKTTVSSNFGNVLSVTVASLFLPFLPMSALQLVLLSLVYEIVCIALPWDTVDDAWTARPRAWDAASIKGFMLELGPVSSLFDIVTFAALFFVVCPAAVDASWSELAAAGDVAGMATFAALFQSGWFVESMWSQTLVVHMLRSPHLPSPRDHAAPALCVLTVLGLALVTWLPASPIADVLGLMPLPTSFFGLLIGIVIAYIALTQLAKCRYIARHGELL